MFVAQTPTTDGRNTSTVLYDSHDANTQTHDHLRVSWTPLHYIIRTTQSHAVVVVRVFCVVFNGNRLWKGPRNGKTTSMMRKVKNALQKQPNSGCTKVKAFVVRLGFVEHSVQYFPLTTCNGKIPSSVSETLLTLEFTHL